MTTQEHTSLAEYTRQRNALHGLSALHDAEHAALAVVALESLWHLSFSPQVRP